MVDFQNPATIFNDLGTSISDALVVVILSFVLLIRCHWQVLRSSSYTSSTESICASLLLLLPWPNTLVSWEFVCKIGFEYGLLRGRRAWRWTAAVGSTFFPVPFSVIYHIP